MLWHSASTGRTLMLLTLCAIVISCVAGQLCRKQNVTMYFWFGLLWFMWYEGGVIGNRCLLYHKHRMDRIQIRLLPDIGVIYTSTLLRIKGE